MFMDNQHGELMRPLLDGLLAAVNAQLDPSQPQLLASDGERPGELCIGETQILRFRAGKVARSLCVSCLWMCVCASLSLSLSRID